MKINLNFDLRFSYDAYLENELNYNFAKLNKPNLPLAKS